jgi:tRNA pseudouridine38-40 synthase
MHEPDAEQREGRGTSEVGPTFRLVLEYAGAGFEGWQAQAGSRPARTVQGVLEEAFASIGWPTQRIQAAGRTDAGVHAEGQVVSVELEREVESRTLVRALNARLPEDVSVRSAERVAPGWHATDEARAKLYRYQVWNGPGRSPLRCARFAFVPERLDVERMRMAARVFVGKHDFSALRGAGSSARTSERTIQAIRVRGEGGDEIAFDVLGEGFLRHMVRNLAGTLIEIGRGRFPVEEAEAILASRDRGRAGPTAPAHSVTGEPSGLPDDASEARTGSGLRAPSGSRSGIDREDGAAD